MTVKIVVVIFAAALFLCPLCCMPAHAQTASCSALWYCSWYSNSSGCVPAPPQGAYNCQPAGDWTIVCSYRTATCPPPPCSTCGSGQGGKPINFATGNTTVSDTDVRIPGRSSGLQLARTWNSIWVPRDSPPVGLFGPNWRSTYEERIYTGVDGFVEYSRGDSTIWSFALSKVNYNSGGVPIGGTFVPVSPSNAQATLTVDVNFTLWTLWFQNGERRVFNYSSGALTSIIDRNGNATQFTYDSLNRLVTVTDAGGRHLYFNYGSNTSYLVTGVTSDVGISLTYQYDANGRLIRVIKPDQTTISYVYDSNSMIASVNDSNGVVLESHTYDSCGRGLTSSRAGGVETLTVTYDQPCWQPAPAQYSFLGD